MKINLPFLVPLIVSFLFYLVSSRSYSLLPGHLESMDLFRLFRGINNFIAVSVPLMLFVFHMLTSRLMFTLLDEKYDPWIMSRVVSLSFIPVIPNCLIYLLVLNGMDTSASLEGLVTQTSFFGLGLMDMEKVSRVFWLGFYVFFTVLTRYEFGMPYGKAAAISLIPTLLVVVGKQLSRLL